MTPELAALQAIGWPIADDEALPHVPAWRELLAEHPNARPARVVEQHRSGYVVADSLETGFRVESLPEWQRPRFPPEQRPAVGDWVLIEGENPKGKIVALLPRRSAIKRGAAGEHYKQQLIAANIDTVFVVCGLDADFNPRRIERYLMLVRGGGAEPVVVLTKADQAARSATSSCRARSRRCSNSARPGSRCARSTPRIPKASPRCIPGCSRATPWCWWARRAPASRR